MPEYIEYEGITYRKATVRYNGIRVNNALIPENGYQALKDEKKAKRINRDTPRRDLEDMLDSGWSEKVKKRDNYTCQKCGSTQKQLNSHHIFSRSHKSTRWDIDNGITLCVSCHKFNNGSAHKDPEQFRTWIISIIGQNEYDKLQYKAFNGRGKLSIGEMEILLSNLIK